MEKNLPRIDPRIFQEIWSKAKQTNPQITQTAIYKRIEAVRKRYRKSISARMAANVLAAEMGIDIHKFLKSNETELRDLRDLITQRQVSADAKIERKQEKEPLIIINKKIVETFCLPRNLSAESKRMAEIYPHVYVIENLVRYVVVDVLKRKYGENWWIQPNIVSKKIAEKVEERRKKEGRNRWHSERGGHEIFYTDFGDLSSIISRNWEEFKSLFPNPQWIQAKLEDTELSRNIIAHNNPLPTREFDRIELFLDDLRKQLNIYTEKQLS